MIRIVVIIAILILAITMVKGAESDTKKSTAVDRKVIGIVLDFSQHATCALSGTSTTLPQRAQVVFTPKGLQVQASNSGTCRVPGSGVLKAAQNGPSTRQPTVVKPIYAPSNDDGC